MNYLELFFILSSIICINSDLIDDRLDCDIDYSHYKESECKASECIWGPVEGHEGTPWCYFDKTKIGYKTVDKLSTSAGLEANLQLKPTAKGSIKLEQIESLHFSVNYLTSNILRFKITDPKNKRYEVPVQESFPLLKTFPEEKDESIRKYSVDLSVVNSTDNFHFTITRKETKTKIWDTSIGGLIFSDQFLQIASYLPSKNIYGFGENTHKTLRHDLNYKTWPLFAMDLLPGEHDKNLYGVHPFYTCLENDGKSHGILFLNSNAMEYTLLPSPALSLKTTGGILDFFVFVGDNPEHVVQLYTSLIGRPVMPPFWGLGFQLTRYGYQNTEHVKKVIDRNVKQRIPMDVHYVDIDYMNEFEDFTYDHKNFAKLPELVADTKRDLNLHWTLILDPAILANDSNYDTFKKGYQQNVFIRWPKNIPISERNNPPNAPTDTDVMYGRVWPRGPAGFPDFFKNVTKIWWTDRIGSLYNQIKFDGLWIDMNEPSNFDDDSTVCPNKPCYYLKCPTSQYDEISARIKPVWVHNGNKRLSYKTLCMTGIQGDGDQYRHYDVHSLYGWSETKPTESAIHSVTGKRGFVLSRSTYVSSNRHTAHWLGDNTSEWPHLRQSIIGMLEFSLFGFSWTGADICGFMGDTNPELCKRWQQLGAFYPFSRNHNNFGSQDQDPAVWVEKGHPEVTDAARDSLNVRYLLLHYLYTLFYRAHTLGETVARPVFHEYPTDNNTYGIDQQFFWGRSILISPTLFPDQKVVNAYLPNDVWYEPTTEFVKLYPKTGHVQIEDPIFGSTVHLRGGSIIPISVKSAVNTKIIRENPIQIEVYPKNKTAFGDMFWDDGESVSTIESGKYNYYEFQLHNSCSLEIKVVKHGFDSSLPKLVETVLIANTNSGEVIANIDGIAINSTIVKEDYISIPVNINLMSKKTGDKWVINWKLKSSNKCNLK